MTFSKFYASLTAGAVGIIIALLTFIWTTSAANVAEALELQRQETRELKTKVETLNAIVIRLDTFVQTQVDLNAWFASEYRRRNLAPDR